MIRLNAFNHLFEDMFGRTRSVLLGVYKFVEFILEHQKQLPVLYPPPLQAPFQNLKKVK
jgi:hypothetical protein